MEISPKFKALVEHLARGGKVEYIPVELKGKAILLAAVQETNPELAKKLQAQLS